MAETKVMNWKEAAEASTDPKIKEMLEQYNSAQDMESAKAIQKQIVEILKAEGITKAPVLDTLKPADADKPTEPETKSDPVAKNAKSGKQDDLSDVEKLKFWKDRLNVLESSRLKNETYEQRKELNRKIYEANEEIYKLREKIRVAKQKAKMEEIKKSGRVSSLSLKQAKLEQLLHKGFSLTNITKHPEGIKADELKKVIESKGFLPRIEQKYHGFGAMWERWKAKFLK